MKSLRLLAFFVFLGATSSLVWASFPRQLNDSFDARNATWSQQWTFGWTNQATQQKQLIQPSDYKSAETDGFYTYLWKGWENTGS